MTGAPLQDSGSAAESAALDLLARRLCVLELEVELCVIGGAILPVVFQGASGTRRPSALFGALGAFRSEVDRIGEAQRLDGGWLDRAARARVALGGAAMSGLQAGCLRVFAPQAEYVLALRCARIAVAPSAEGQELAADIVYLARLLGLATTAEILAAVVPYLPESVMGDALEGELRGLRGVTP